MDIIISSFSRPELIYLINNLPADIQKCKEYETDGMMKKQGLGFKYVLTEKGKHLSIDTLYGMYINLNIGKWA